jgi:hypothetical protein
VLDRIDPRTAAEDCRRVNLVPIEGGHPVRRGLDNSRRAEDATGFAGMSDRHPVPPERPGVFAQD